MFGSQQWMYSSGGFYPKDIKQSLRFNDDASHYLDRTPSSSSSRGKWTFSAWIKLGNLHAQASIRGLFGAGSSTTSWTGIYINDDKLYFKSEAASTTVTDVYTNALLRDVASWYHIVVVLDAAQSSSSDRVKIYLNNQLQTLTTSTIPSQNSNFYQINNNVTHSIGAIKRTDPDFLYDGYMAEVHFVDGIALTPSSFGETKQDIWVAKDYSGTHGTNGFYLPFDDSSSIGTDESSNTNNWTLRNISSTDIVGDGPTNNFSTLNPLDGASVTLSEGNLKGIGASDYQAVKSTMALPSTGKYYWEVIWIASSGNIQDQYIGVAGNDTALSGTSPYPQSDSPTVVYTGNGNIYKNGSVNQSSLSTIGSSEIVSMAVDMDAETIQFYKNNSALGTAVTLPTTSESFLAVLITTNLRSTMHNFGQDSSFSGNKIAQGNTDSNGNGDFYYSPPSGYLALCTANLPDPAIDPSQDASPEDHFNTALYTGSVSSVTGLGFQPDFTWIKQRSSPNRRHHLQDVVRGATKSLFSDAVTSEETSSNYLTSFDSDGFSLGGSSEVNGSGLSYTAWNWKAGGTGVSNTDGSITSTVSANTTAGFSIVSYTGTGSSGTIGHGLNSAPAMVIVKSRSSSYYWAVYHKSIGAGNDIALSSSIGASSTNNWNSTTPTSSVFSVPSGTSETNYLGVTFIAYCFHSVEGYSKFSSYTGNGSSNGTFVHLGFRPAFVIVKKTSASGEWVMFDNKRSGYNKDNDFLYANTTNSEYDGATYTRLDLTSNGFKHRDNSSDTNGSGATYVYMAFAEQPFKYSNAR